MWFRKVLPGLLAGGPFIMLASVVVNAHNIVQSDGNEEFGREIHQEILAYRKPLVAVESYFNSPSKDRDSQLGTITDVWIRNFQSGSLKTIRPIAFQVSSAELIISDISAAKFRLIGEWARLADASRAKNNFAEEAKCLAKLVNLANVDKYFDLNSVHHCALVQGKALARLAEITPKLDPKNLESIKKDILESKEQTRPLVELTDYTRNLHQAYLAKRSKAPIPVEFAISYQALAEAADTGAPESIQRLRQVSTKIFDDDFVKIGSLARSCIQSEAGYKLALANVIDSLSR